MIKTLSIDITCPGFDATTTIVAALHTYSISGIIKLDKPISTQTDTNIFVKKNYLFTERSVRIFWLHGFKTFVIEFLYVEIVIHFPLLRQR